MTEEPAPQAEIPASAPAPVLAMQAAALEASPAPTPAALATPAPTAAPAAGSRVTNDPRVNRRAPAPVEIQTQVLKVEAPVAAAAQPDPARNSTIRASNDPRKRRPDSETPS
jgi:hypothetical protein